MSPKGLGRSCFLFYVCLRLPLFLLCRRARRQPSNMHGSSTCYHPCWGEHVALRAYSCHSKTWQHKACSILVLFELLGYATKNDKLTNFQERLAQQRRFTAFLLYLPSPATGADIACKSAQFWANIEAGATFLLSMTRQMLFRKDEKLCVERDPFSPLSLFLVKATFYFQIWTPVPENLIKTTKQAL